MGAPEWVPQTKGSIGLSIQRIALYTPFDHSRSRRIRAPVFNLICEFIHIRYTHVPQTGCDSPSSVASGRNRENSVPLRVSHVWTRHLGPNESGKSSDRRSTLYNLPPSKDSGRPSRHLLAYAVRRREPRLLTPFSVSSPLPDPTRARDTVAFDVRGTGQLLQSVRWTLCPFERLNPTPRTCLCDSEVLIDPLGCSGLGCTTVGTGSPKWSGSISNCATAGSASHKLADAMINLVIALIIKFKPF